jgi:hypothetical protein
MYRCSRGVDCYSLSLAECAICSSIGIIGCTRGCYEFVEKSRWDAVVVKEVSVDDVDYNSGGGSSCVFRETQTMGDTSGDVGEFVGRSITIICGGVLLI